MNDRTTDLFESQWPLPHGVSYNSYLVVREKVPLVDSAKAPMTEEILWDLAWAVTPTSTSLR